MADLTVNDLALRYGANEVLRGISIAVPAGKVIALLGASGSGKTSLLRAIAGLVTPDRGSMAIGDTILFDADRHTELPAHARPLGLLSQASPYRENRTVFECVAADLAPHGGADAEIGARANAALAQTGLAELAERHLAQLSLADRQRVTLARALVGDPAAVLMDEPLSHLDARLCEEARGPLRELLAAQKRAVLLATSDPVEAMALGDRVALLGGGAIEQEGTPSELYHAPATLYAAEFMGRNNRFEGTLVENSGQRAVIEAIGVRFEGVSRTRAAVGEKATGVVRVERTMLGGGPAANRILMTLKAQMCIGPRWELLLARDTLTVRAYTSAPLKHEVYHVEFPPQALWIF